MSSRNNPEMGRKGQKSIRKFTDEEREFIEKAMRIESIDSESQWVARAAVMWARQVIAIDAGLLPKIVEAAKQPDTGSR